MFDVDDSIRRNSNPLAGYLDLKPLILLDAIGKTPQFCDKLFPGIVFLNLTFAFILGCSHHRLPSISRLVPFIYNVPLIADLRIGWIRQYVNERQNHSAGP